MPTRYSQKLLAKNVATPRPGNLDLRSPIAANEVFFFFFKFHPRLEPAPKYNSFAFLSNFDHYFGSGSSPELDWLTTLGYYDPLCQVAVRDHAFLRVYVAPSVVSVTKRSLRVSFSDQLANLGGSYL